MLPKFLNPYHINKSNLIRLGPNTDGGYVIDKRVLNKTNTLITCGLNDDWEFEKSFSKKNIECTITAYDHTVNKEFWLRRFKKDIIALLCLRKLKLNKILDVFKYIEYQLFFKENKRHFEKKIVSKKKNYNEITIPKILKKYNKVILKIDIEGDEYKILNDIKKNTNKIICLIIEFHNIDKNIKKIKNFLKKIDLKLIHLHANNYGGIDIESNPKVIELTFINSKMINMTKILSKRKYPIKGLDYKNLKRREDIKIKFHE